MEWKAKDMPSQKGENQATNQATKQGVSKEHSKDDKELNREVQQQRKQIDGGKQTMPRTTDKSRGINELEIMLRKNQFSSLRIQLEVTTNKVVRGTTPTNPPP